MEISKKLKKKLEILFGLFTTIILMFLLLTITRLSDGGGLFYTMTAAIGTSFGFLAASIICTAGIGGLVWYMIWWAIGKFVFKIFVKVFNVSYILKTEENLTFKERSLIGYILQSREAGINHEQIKENLIVQGGWTKEEVNNAKALFDISWEITKKQKQEAKKIEKR